MRVLITRSKENSQTLANHLATLGDTLIPFPVMTFRPTTQQTALQAAIDVLNLSTMAIFISQPAVHFTVPLIQQHWKTLPPIQWAAIGPATQKALRDYDILAITPPNPPYESESLLAMPQLQQVRHQTITLFRGNGGRELLYETLTLRGATVHMVESYERALLDINIALQLKTIREAPVDALVITSLESLHYFLTLVGPAIDWLKEIPTIVVGLRMHERINKLEFKRTWMAIGADDASILPILFELKGR